MKKIRNTTEYIALHETLKLTQAWLNNSIKMLETCEINEQNIADFKYQLETTAVLLNGILKNGNLKNFMNKVKENN